MRGLWRELNEFFSSTSIHGFPYISDVHSRSTRIIWCLIILAGFGATSYFLYYTLDGFDEKYISTTIETRNIKEYPFPAVTFYPSEYNSKNAFKRNFLNQFEFTRYQQSSQLLNNTEFENLYGWLFSRMNIDIFQDVEIFLKKRIFDDEIYNFYDFDEDSDNYNNKDFDDYVCWLVALNNKNISLQEDIRNTHASNMYKFARRRFRGSSRDNLIELYLKREIKPIIQNAIVEQNITESEVSESCKDTENKNIELINDVKAMILSFIGLFYIKDNVASAMNDLSSIDIGAGDLATGPYKSSLSRGQYFVDHCFEAICREINYEFIPPNHDYISAHTLVTKMYNDMESASLPVSVLEFPAFFTLPDNNFFWNRNDAYVSREARASITKWYFKTLGRLIIPYDLNIKSIKRVIEIFNVTDETMRNYHYLWYAYNNNYKNVTIFCWEDSIYKDYNCGDESLRFHLAEDDWHFEIVEFIRNNSDKGMIIEASVNSPPCTDEDTAMHLKIQSVCEFLHNISINKERSQKVRVIKTATQQLGNSYLTEEQVSSACSKECTLFDEFLSWHF